LVLSEPAQNPWIGTQLIMEKNTPSSLAQGQERMNMLLEHLRVVENMLTLLNHRSELEDQMREAHMMLLDKKMRAIVEEN